MYNINTLYKYLIKLHALVAFTASVVHAQQSAQLFSAT